MTPVIKCPICSEPAEVAEVQLRESEFGPTYNHYCECLTCSDVIDFQVELPYNALAKH